MSDGECRQWVEGAKGRIEKSFGEMAMDLDGVVTMNLDTRTALLQKTYIFGSLSEAEARQIASFATEQDCYPGQVVFSQGQAGSVLYLIVDGTVKVSRASSDGRDKILAFLFAGDVFGDMSVLDGRPRSATAECLEATHLIMVPGERFRAALRSNYGLVERVIGALTARLREADADLVDLSYSAARARLESALSRLAQRTGRRVEDGWLLDLRVTHEELASYLGTSRETVTRLLGALADDGDLQYRGHTVWLRRSTVADLGSSDTDTADCDVDH